VLNENSQLFLHVGVSPLLIENGSDKISVYVNELFVDSITLEGDNRDIWLPVRLPTSVLNQQRDGRRLYELNVRVSMPSVNLENQCRDINTDDYWMTVFPDSFFSIDRTWIDVPTLQGYPFPFVTDREETSVTIVLPENPVQDDFSAALSVAANLGQRASLDFEVNIVDPIAIQTDTIANQYLIVLGSIDKQPLITEILPEITSDLEGLGLYPLVDNFSLGILQTIISPWNPERIVLVISGYNQAAYERALDRVLTTYPLVPSSGTWALVNENDHVLLLDRAEEEDIAKFLPQTTLATATAQIAELASPVPTIQSFNTPNTPDVDTIDTARDEGTGAVGELSNFELIILLTAISVIIVIVIISIAYVLRNREQDE
jgi:hypothetical protein